MATATDTIGQTSSRSVSVRTSPGVQGSWVGTYGVDGYVLAAWNGTTADLAVLPQATLHARAGRPGDLGLADDRRPGPPEPRRDRAPGDRCTTPPSSGSG